MNIRALIMLGCVLATPVAAAAQDAALFQTQQGPMTVERVSNQFVIAPEYKVTDIHSETGQIIGVSGGRVLDDVLLIGAGGYLMVDGSRGTDLRYGGVVVEWRPRTDHLIGYSVRALGGFGQATRRLLLTVPVGSNVRDNDRDNDRDGNVLDGRFRFRQGFFMIEPEADMIVNMTRRLRIHVGAGYRATTANTRGVSSLNGATGTVGLQVAW